MKKVLAVLVSLALFGSFAIVQAADEQKPAQDMPMSEHQMMMKGGDGKGMMDCQMMKGGDCKCKDCPMMKDGDGKCMKGGMKDGMMKHHQMAMHHMMKMMKEMMAIQKKMISGATPEEKTKMEADLSAMMEKMDKMMSSHGMMHMKQPPAGEQKKEGSMPMEHMH